MSIDYYYAWITSTTDCNIIGKFLNKAILDDDITLKDYQHLVSVAKSLGFKFGNNFELI